MAEICADQEIFTLKIISVVLSFRVFLKVDGYNRDKLLEHLVYYEVSSSLIPRLPVFIQGEERGYEASIRRARYHWLWSSIKHLPRECRFLARLLIDHHCVSSGKFCC